MKPFFSMLTLFDYSLVEHMQMLNAFLVQHIFIGCTAWYNRFPFHTPEAQFSDQVIALFSRGDSINAGDLVTICYKISEEIDGVRYQNASIEVPCVSG